MIYRHQMRDLIIITTVKHYPTWLPGSAWKRRTLKAAVLVKAMHDVPYNMVRDQLVSIPPDKYSS